MQIGDVAASRREVVAAEEVLCRVELEDNALTVSSIEALSALGVPVGQQPGRDASIAGRMA